MIPLSKFKKQLGEAAQNLTNEEIELIYNTQYKLVEIIFDKWLREKNTKNSG